MLAEKELLDSLLVEDNLEGYKDCNDDHDFGNVLESYGCGGTKTHGRKIRYSDGKERVFSFDN